MLSAVQLKLKYVPSFDEHADLGLMGISVHRAFNGKNIRAAEFSCIHFKKRLSAKNQINEVTREREVNDILPLKNHIIRYTGILYTPKESDNTFTLDILNGGKWDSPIDKDLKD